MDHSELLTSIIEHETSIQHAKSSGPGGQNVNKRETKAELYFNIDQSSHLTEVQKERLKNLEQVRNHISHEGVLRITSQEERSLGQNKDNVIHKFKNLLMEILTEPIERIETKPSQSSKQKRLQIKKVHGQKKQSRNRKPDQEI